MYPPVRSPLVLLSCADPFESALHFADTALFDQLRQGGSSEVVDFEECRSQTGSRTGFGLIDR